MCSIKNTLISSGLSKEEILNGLKDGRTEAFIAIYSILEKVLIHFRANTNAVLVHEGITTKESLLSHLYDKGKLSKDFLSSQHIEDIYKWVWTVAYREIINLLRRKQKTSYIKSLDSYDAEPCTGDTRSLLDKIGDIPDDDNNVISSRDKFDAVVKRMKTMNIDSRYEIIFYGLAKGDDKAAILPKFIEAAVNTGRALGNESRYSANYDLVFHRGSKALSKHISYRDIVSNLTM